MHTFLARSPKLVLSLVALGFMAGGEARAADPVRIGSALPLSGAAASYGYEARDGSTLAVEEINARGGILGGRKVEVVFEDDKGTPQGGVAAVQKLISVHHVKAITGGTNSSVVLAESSITRGKILHVNGAAQADAITNQGSPWLFQINNTVSANSHSFNSYLVDTLKPKTAVYMGENTEFNKIVLALLQESLDKAGIRLLNVATYDAGTNDFTSIITRSKSFNADMLYVSDAYPARAAQLWKQVRQAGGFKFEAMSPGVVVPGMIDSSDGAMDGVVTGEIYMAAMSGDANKGFVERFKKRFGEEPRKGSLVAYEAVHLIAAAMEKAGTDSDYAKISKVIRENTWASPRGQLRFDAKGRASAPFFFIQQVKGGRLVEVARVKVD